MGEGWEFPPHLRLLYQTLHDVACRRIRRLLVNLPPGHGKSETISKYYPAWKIGRFPRSRVLLLSYAGGFAASWGREARNVLAEHGPAVFGVRVSPTARARDSWQLDGHRGRMWAVGLEGQATGKRVDDLLIDDPIKDAKAARSKVMRDALWDWYRTVAYTRLEPDGAIVIIQTRWSEDDLAGRILRHARDTGERWTVLSLPALAEEGDLLGRRPGEALWPSRFPAETLDEIRRTMSAYWWSALYQQRPAPEEGALFRRSSFRYFTEESGTYVLHRPDGGPKRFRVEDCWVFTTADLAISLKETADYTVMCAWAVTPEKDLLLLDLERRRIEGPDQERLLHAFAGHYPRLKTMLIEGTQYQAALAQYAKREGLPARAVKVDRDKFSRAQNPAARMENGSIYFRQNALWLDALEGELLTFPNGEHDDQVDNLSMAGEFLTAPEEPIALAGVVISTPRGRRELGGGVANPLLGP